MTADKVGQVCPVVLHARGLRGARRALLGGLRLAIGHGHGVCPPAAWGEAQTTRRQAAAG